ncbi:hypothetical protein ACFYT4_25525 [Streptomyces sp. NPDC004609]|uniref:hypothetical protein n=1 Tax=Streptomyces sp. NPDC004609 TaxID=3364704 RepID=UPI0036D10D87
MNVRTTEAASTANTTGTAQAAAGPATAGTDWEPGTTDGRGPRPLGRVVGWGTLAVALTAFAIFESVKYGLPTTTAAVLFFLAPGLITRTTGTHSTAGRIALNGWIPLAVMVFYAFGPLIWPPLFTAALAWETRVVIARMLRRG